MAWLSMIMFSSSGVTTTEKRPGAVAPATARCVALATSS